MLWIGAEMLDQLYVEQFMQITRAEPASRYALAVAAGVVIVGGVERLMHVADEMQQEF